MNVKVITLGPVSANCYIVCDDAGVGSVIDPGDYNISLEKAISACEIKELKYIICTHGHFDHISGVSRLKEKHTQALVVVGSGDEAALGDACISAAASFGLPFFPCKADMIVKDGDVLSAGQLSYRVIASPGHTPGGIMLYCEEGGFAFTGDSLFKGSVGRTDLYGGNHSQLMESVRKIKSLPSDTRLFCGHGESTTTQNELMYNFYLL